MSYSVFLNFHIKYVSVGIYSKMRKLYKLFVWIVKLISYPSDKQLFSKFQQKIKHCFHCNFLHVLLCFIWLLHCINTKTAGELAFSEISSSKILATYGLKKLLGTIPFCWNLTQVKNNKLLLYIHLAGNLMSSSSAS